MGKNTYVVRNEPDPEQVYHCDALAECFPEAIEIDFPAGERFDPTDADAVILSGSTAGVYERDERSWIPEQEELIRKLVRYDVPTLGVCFGHQIANTALGGSVEHVGTTAGLVPAEFEDVPLFNDVSPVVPAAHGDIVTESGTKMEPIATAGHASIFATRHCFAPLWTVQFHPELTAEYRPQLTELLDWDEDGYTFADTSEDQVFDNFNQYEVESPSSTSEPQANE
jgi:GMP synthase - Glutamine amidotransferase domain